MNEVTAHMKALLWQMQKEGYRSYDHYDFWGRGIGIFLRKTRNLFTTPIVGVVYVMEVLFPKLFRIGLKPDIPLETLPSFLKAMLAYRQLTADESFEADRLMLTEHMLKKLGKSSSGRGLGHNFNWYTNRLVPAFTPCVPHTAYLVTYILEAYEGSKMPQREREVLRDAGEFVFNDTGLVDLPDGSSKVRYAEDDERYVINANSYAALLLIKLGSFFGRDDYIERSLKIMKFVTAQQNKDGSWFYFEKGSVKDKDNFIDCFHSAFVLENLLEYSGFVEDNDASGAFVAGLDSFIAEFVNKDHTVNHFKKSHLPLGISIDTRSTAEAINLLSVSSGKLGRCLGIAEEVFKKVKDEMYDASKSYYYHRRYSFGLSRMNYGRWATVPMVIALANVGLAKMKLEGNS